MVDKIPPSRREFLATDAAATSALLLDQHQQTDPAIAHVDDVATLARIPTGFQQLDILTGGLHRRELVLLASRPGVGMTSLALNITDYTAVEAYTPTLYVSLGTSRFEITRRLMCARGEVCHTAMRRHTVSPGVGLRMTQAGAELSSAPLYLDDRPLRTVAEIGTTAQRLSDRFPLEPGFFQITALIRPRRTSFTGWFFVAIIASFSNLESMSHRFTWLTLLCGRTARVLHRAIEYGPHSRQPTSEDRVARIASDGQMSARTYCRSHRRSTG